MSVANDALSLEHVGPAQFPAVVIKDGQPAIHVRGPVPDWLTQAERSCAAGRPDLAGRLLSEEVLATLQQQVDADPGRVDLLYVTGKLLMRLGRLSQALPLYQRSVDLEPCAPGYYLLSELLHALGQVGESLDWAQKAIEEDPDHPDYIARLAYSLFYSGRIEAGVDMMRRAYAQRPGSARLLEQCVAWEHYLPGRQRECFLPGYLELGRLISNGAEICQHHRNSPDPDRRLRVGVISPFFRNNSVAYTFEPFLDAYDRERLEVFGYANQKQADGDDGTERMRGKFDHFRFVWGLNTRTLVELILRDQIDILMEIGGYVRHHRFDVLACKPAPIQIDFGSVDTTGLRQMDYRFTDEIRDPRHWSQPYVETSVYLAGGCLCYRPISAPAVTSPLPVLQNGYVTFGAFHDHLKLNASVLGLWARIMDALTNARLVIKCAGVRDPGVRGRLVDQCRLAGLDTERIELLDWLPHTEHLSLYDRVDLLLDAFPFNGAIMTLEGLWMGVPTISLTGDLWMARTGHLILNQVGLEAFVADTPEAYVEKAIGFSQQWDALARIRTGLRQGMLASSLCNPHRFASELTQAFRHMWYRWCRSQGVPVAHKEPADLFVKH